ncbi:hypothetical protein LOK49_LG04G00239 [Camellia lanceoleosa]|uniref:Uncharacterized protein n=1 Tax=Camellia lanceoleosa TaxID=1840588 RepID=A0ACC0I8J7_9ERIC|nr:hypothetical protein LOK49_LG04G00239 [Camellia lanceoleosa]
MPCLKLSTNVNLEGIDISSILKEATSAVADLIGKPEAHVMVMLKGSVPIAIGGIEDPAAYVEVVSIGALKPDVNKKLSAVISTILCLFLLQDSSSNSMTLWATTLDGMEPSYKFNILYICTWKCNVKY